MADDIFDAKKVMRRLENGRSPQLTDPPTLPELSAIRAAESSLVSRLRPDRRVPSHPDDEVVRHILDDIVPALTGQAASSRYYGFVTGGVLPVAEWADNLVSRLDQNVQVHLPAQTVATTVEQAALVMLAGLLRLVEDEGTDPWQAKTFTTGATASNVLGLACGREAVLNSRLGDGPDGSVGELGLLAACARAGISKIQILTSAAHSSLYKAASVVGIGRRCVKELPRSQEEPWKLDLAALEDALAPSDTVSIIAISAGDVNTGGFGLDGFEEWMLLREFADKYNAWIHVDGAFGIFARVLDRTGDFAALGEMVQGIELADSIAVDGHKVLNVPYDCGMFFTRSAKALQSTFLNPNAAYLSSDSKSSILSPLNVGLENSRRFRALPAYAALLSEGGPGVQRLVSNMVRLAQRLAAFIRDSPYYDLLPHQEFRLDHVFIIVLFRAKDRALNDVLVQKINETRQMYVSGTAWKGQKAVRIAVSSWKVDVERDFNVVVAILKAVAAGRDFNLSDVGT